MNLTLPKLKVVSGQSGDAAKGSYWWVGIAEAYCPPVAIDKRYC